MDSQEPTWRVYLPEWLIVYTSDADGQEGKAECRSAYARKYGGRVRPEDVRVVPSVMGRLGDAGPHSVQLRLPNLKGEHKEYDAAVALASDLAGQIPSGDPVAVVVVPRGSDEEQELLAYGKKMLPDAR